MNSYIHRHQILTDWVTIILFLLFLLLPEFNRQLRIIPDPPSTEKRRLASYPMFSIRNITDFVKNYDSYYNDHFGFRVRLISTNTYLHVNLFGISGIERVIIGKRGWLFHNIYGTSDPRALSGWQGYNPYSFNQLRTIQKNLEAENMWFTEQNITFFILPAPDKHSIYPEYLPWQFDTVIGPSRLAQFFEHMKRYSNLKLIDVRKILLTAKTIQPLDTYYKSDSHWNSVGAFFAYQEIMKRVLAVYPQFVSHRFEDFIQDQKVIRLADLATMVNIDVSNIFEHELVPKQNVTFYHLGPKKDRIVFFGDSFSHILKDYFCRHFNDVQYVRIIQHARSRLNKTAILEYQPNVFIFESVERAWTVW